MNRVRFLNAHGQPVCLHCGLETNAAYALHGDFLVCWHCGEKLSYSAEAVARIVTLTKVNVPEAR